VLRETWEAIAQHKSARMPNLNTLEKQDANGIATPTLTQTMTTAEASNASKQCKEGPANEAAIQRKHEPEPHVKPVPKHHYICPVCAQPVSSPVRTGRVDHRHTCGYQFRVVNGSVVGKKHKHTCPTCGTTVLSTKAAGRIQVQHKHPSGRMCRCTRWQANPAPH
jgi:rubrerythrin